MPSTSTIAHRIEELFAPDYGRTGDSPAMASPLSTAVSELLGSSRVNLGLPPEQLEWHFPVTNVPADPVAVDDYFEGHVEQLVQHSINVHSPRCLGHMTGVLPSFVRRLSGLVAVLNQNMVKCESSRAFTVMERSTLAMLHRAVYRQPAEFYDRHAQRADSALGVMASGGTAANIMALWCARNHCLGALDGFTGVRREGLVNSLAPHGARDAVVLASELAHYSIAKAVCVLGLGERHLLPIPVDEQGRMRIDQLRRVADDCVERRRRIVAIVGVAGTTDCGSIDPLEQIADVAQQHGVHFHLDAAWAAPLVFSRKYRGLLAGIERADSITVDGHKQLHLPLGTSVLLLREPRLARQHVSHEAEYMLRADSFDQGRFTLEGSRAGSVVYLNAALHLIGQEGFDYLAQTNLERARELAEMIAASHDFELLCNPSTNIVLYRYVPQAWRSAPAATNGAEAAAINGFNERIQHIQFSRGATFVSRTRVRHLQRCRQKPIVALRAVINNPLTTSDDLRAVLDDQREIAAELQRSSSSL